MNIRFARYNNKSRKGTYIGIKKPGQRERILKWKGGIIDDYVEIVQNNKNYRELHKTLQKRPRGSITSDLQEGVTSAKVLLSDLGDEGARTAVYKKLLTPLVKKKELLDIILANRHKLGRLLATDLNVVGETKEGGKTYKNVTLFNIKTIGKRTLEQTYSEYYGRRNLKKGVLIGHQAVGDLANITGIGTITRGRLGTDGKIYYVEVTVTLQR